MQASGVGVADDCVSQFNDLKLKHSLKYIVYSMNDKNTEINVLKTANKDATYDDFCKEFPVDKCRYGVCDCEYTDPKTGGQRNKIAFFVWCAPTNSPSQRRGASPRGAWPRGRTVLDMNLRHGRCPDNAKVKDKMLYASSKDELKKRLVGIAVEMQVRPLGGPHFVQPGPGQCRGRGSCLPCSLAEPTRVQS